MGRCFTGLFFHNVGAHGPMDCVSARYSRLMSALAEFTI